MACSSGEARICFEFEPEYDLGCGLVSCASALLSQVASEGQSSTFGPLCILCEVTLVSLDLFLDLCVGGVW